MKDLKKIKALKNFEIERKSLGSVKGGNVRSRCWSGTSYSGGGGSAWDRIDD